MPEPIFSPEQLAQIKAYAEPKYTAHLIELVVSLAFDVVLLAWLVRPMYRLSERIAAWCAPRLEWARQAPVARGLVRLPGVLWGSDGAGVALAFLGVTSLVSKAVDVPYTFYLGYFHEKAFGLSKESFGRFVWDDVKSLVLGSLMMACLTFGLLGLVRRLKYWWAIVGPIFGAVLLFSAAIDPYRSQVYVDSHPLEDGPLRTGITELMAKAHVPFGDIRVEETSKKSVKPDAYFAGQGPTRTIVLYDSLIAALTTEEVLAAVAHEAGHADESRWAAWALSAASLMALMVLIELLLRLTARRGWWGVKERADVRALPLVFVVYTLLLHFAYPISLVRQRHAELAADQYALNLTQNPAAFRSMLGKVARIAMMDPDPPRWHVVLHMGHPPLDERVAAIDAWKTPEAGRP